MTQARKVDLPALGRPTRPMSAKSLSSSSASKASPGSPTSAMRGVWRVEDLKWALPKPPSPPLAMTAVCWSLVRSASNSPSRRTMVPIGTSTIKSSPLRPAERWPEPFLPSSADRMGL